MHILVHALIKLIEAFMHDPLDASVKVGVIGWCVGALVVAVVGSKAARGDPQTSFALWFLYALPLLPLAGAHAWWRTRSTARRVRDPARASGHAVSAASTRGRSVEKRSPWRKSGAARRQDPRKLLDVLRARRVTLATKGELIAITVPGSEAIETWASLRKLSGSTGYWPIVTTPDALDGRDLGDDRTAAQVLREARRLDPLAHTETAMAQHLEGEDGSVEPAAPRGDWPSDATPSSDFQVVRQLDGSYLKSASLLFVPCTQGSEVPAWLPFGDWNDCPADEWHVAFLARWQRTHGAEPVAMTRDTLEMLVARPPKSRADALALAREHYAYSPDIVIQGTDTIEALAATLIGASVWFFWWD